MSHRHQVKPVRTPEAQDVAVTWSSTRCARSRNRRRRRLSYNISRGRLERAILCTCCVISMDLYFKRIDNFSFVVFTKKSRKLLPELWCIASRDKPPEKNISSFEKHCVLDLECRILSQEPSDSCILYFNVVFHGK